MQVTETLSDGLKRAYTVVVPEADIESRRSQRLAEIGKTLKLPGFRPGKVPMPVVKQRFGGAVRAEVVEDSVNKATQQVLSDRGLRPAVQPKIDLVRGADANDLEFSVQFELLPDVPMPDFASIELTRPRVEPSDEAIDAALGELAARRRELVLFNYLHPAEKGDFLTVDFIGMIDGVPFPGGEGKDMDVEVAGPGFIPGFTEQLEGANVGEVRTIHVTFPAEYGSKDLAGKQATFDIRIKALKQSVVPSIDDAFAAKVGFEDLADLRQALIKRAQAEYDQLGRLRIKRQLLDALAAHATFSVPESLTNHEFEQIWQRLQADRGQGKLDPEDSGKDDETLKAEYLAIAERRVRLGLLLAEIGRQNNIVVSAEEMTRAIRTEAGRYPGQEAQVVEFFRKNPQAAETLRGPIFEEKVVDFVLELARVTDVIVTAEELARDPDAAAAPALAAPATDAAPDANAPETTADHAATEPASDGAGQTTGAE
jgi:trigger factor